MCLIIYDHLSIVDEGSDEWIPWIIFFCVPRESLSMLDCFYGVCLVAIAKASHHSPLRYTGILLCWCWVFSGFYMPHTS